MWFFIMHGTDLKLHSIDLEIYTSCRRYIMSYLNSYNHMKLYYNIAKLNQLFAIKHRNSVLLYHRFPVNIKEKLYSCMSCLTSRWLGLKIWIFPLSSRTVICRLCEIDSFQQRICNTVNLLPARQKQTVCGWGWRVMTHAHSTGPSLSISFSVQSLLPQLSLISSKLDSNNSLRSHI